MRKLLILGASVLQLPAIVKAKEMGFYVGVVDLNPEAIGVKHADEFFTISTIDVEGVLQTAKTFQPNGIMTLATDMPMRAIAVATSALGLPGLSLDTTIKSTDKGEMMKVFQKNQIESPWFFVLHSFDDLSLIAKEITFPCILKPVDNAGSRGVILVETEKEIETAYQYSLQNARNGTVIIEEFMPGNEVSVEVMVINHEIHILAITDKITTNAPHFVEMGHNQPSQLPIDDQERIKDLTMRAVKALGIDNGPAHVEIMYTPQGPKMIELGARMGGDNISTHLVPLSTGIDMVKATIQLSAGETPDLKPKFMKGSAIRYLSCPPGILTTIYGIEDAIKTSGVKEITLTKKEGDKITPIYSSTDRVGYVVAQANNAIEAIKICDDASNKILFKVTNP